jgi:hypothetical protein
MSTPINNRAGVQILFVALVLSAGCSTTDLDYIRNATLSPLNDRVPVRRQNQIEGGDATVLLIREWDPGNPFASDDARYRKLSLQLSGVAAGAQYRLGDGDTRIRLTAGATGQGAPGWDCIGTSAAGSVSILKEEAAPGRLKADLDITVRCDPVAGVPATDPAEVRFCGKYWFDEIEFGDLTPWLGATMPPAWACFAAVIRRASRLG